MKKEGKLKTILLCIAGGILLALFVVMIIRSQKKDSVVSELGIDGEQSSITAEETPRPGATPKINTDAGADVKITPGGVEYSFIDTSGMSDEEIKELEARLDEEAGYTHDENTNIGSPDITRGMYINSEFSCVFPSGSVLRVGVHTDKSDAIYLNPVYEATDDEYIFSAEQTTFAFYLKTIYGNDIIAAGTPNVYNAASNAEYKNLVITDRTYDSLVPAEYDAAGNGAKWVDLNNFHGFDGQDCNIDIRIVRLPDGQLMGVARLHIAFDSASQTYRITGLTNRDVSVTGELQPELRSDAVEKAFEFFCSDDKGQSTFVDQSYWDAYRSSAIVEKTDGFYFPRLFDASGNVITAGRYSGMDIYAVNINYPGYGFATIYMAPQQQIEGMRSSAPSDEDIQPFAYDAFKPYDKSTIFVPNYQKDEFYS